MAKKIFITGGAGFIARNLFEDLKDEYNVVSCKREELDLLDSMRVFDYIKNNSFDVIIHTATYDAAPKNSTKDPNKVLEYNLKMFFNIVRCKDYFGKMIYFGSGAEYDRRCWIPKMREEYFDRYPPQDQYGFSKYVMTKYIQLTDKIYNLRLFAVFGKYEDWRYRFISNVCCKVVLDLPIIINQDKIFDFLYVKDLVKIVKWFIENDPKRKVYNVCSGIAYSFSCISRKILEIAKKDLEIIIKDKNSIEYSGAHSYLLEELGNFEFTPIDESLKELYSWYETNKHMINKDEFHY
ncbi:MAG: NAD(P)-dependent oxidoreductase [Candidatus Omnitrophica bacterium]|nr:NAD(P)-dependent oxidoreductase [Candidatus Omnitrophota bacterium]